MNVTMFSTKPYDQTYFSTRADKLNIHYLPTRLNAQTALLAKESEVVCCFVNDVLNEQVVQQLSLQGVKLIALRCAGYNNVDLQACKTHNIAVCRVPDYSPHAVAEHAVALMLDLNRNIHRAHNRVRENDYSLDGLMGFDLYEKTIGVIGTGKIGNALIGIMQGFGCHVLAYDPTPKEIRANVRYTNLEEVLSHSDILSLHCPLTPSTHHIINEQTLALTKPKVMLINTSRGGLIDTPAVIRALKSGHIGYLGLDVYEEESEFFFEDFSNTAIQDDTFSRLQTFPNVTITSHQGFFTHEAMNQISQVTIQNILHFKNNELAKCNLIDA